MAQYFLGEVMASAINFAPVGFLPCDGRLLEIRLNSALFSLLGTTFGGDGKTTFALPDLRGRTPMGMGQGPGLSQQEQGSMLGSEGVALTQAEMGPHSHALKATTNRATSSTPAGNYFGGPATGQSDSAPPGASSDVHVASSAMMTSSGGGAAHDNMQPSLVISYYICMNGDFPGRW